MVTALATRDAALTKLGVNEYQGGIQVGHLDEGAQVGKLVMMRFASSQELSLEELGAIFGNAGIPASRLPRGRAASDAWRIATKALDEQAVRLAQGSAKMLVRDWKNSKHPRRDITLESIGADQFDYASPAAVLSFDKETQDFLWLNRTGDERLDDELLAARFNYDRLRGAVDGEAIYRAIVRLVEETAPLPLGQGAYLIWQDHQEVVTAISSVVAALNSATSEDGPASSVHIFSVVNTPDDRDALSGALDATIKKEVGEALERIGRIMSNPDRLVESQGKIELKKLESLSALAREFEGRFTRDMRHIHTQLEMLAGFHGDLMHAIAKNSAQKKRQKKGL